MALGCYPSTWEGEPARSEAQGYPLLHREFQANLDYMRPWPQEEIEVQMWLLLKHCVIPWSAHLMWMN